MTEQEGRKMILIGQKGTDMEKIEVGCEISVDIECLKARLFDKILRKLKDSEFEDGQQLENYILNCADFLDAIGG